MEDMWKTCAGHVQDMMSIVIRILSNLVYRYMVVHERG